MLIDLMATQAKQRHLDIRDMAEAGHCAVCCRAAWAMLSVRRGSQHNADHSLCRPQNKTLVLRRNLSHSQCLVLSMNCNKQSDTVYNVLIYFYINICTVCLLKLCYRRSLRTPVYPEAPKYGCLVHWSSSQKSCSCMSVPHCPVFPELCWGSYGTLVLLLNC